MYGFREFVEASGLLSYAADLAEGYRTMKILKTLIQRADDGELMEADTIEYEGKLWIVRVACRANQRN